MQDQNTVYFDLLNTADAAFGRSLWSHEIVSQTIDFVNRKDNSCTVGCATLIKIQLDSGRYHQDFGYSESTAQTEGLAFFRARNSSCTNALRRTMLAFEETRIKIASNHYLSVSVGNKSPSSSGTTENTEKRKRLAMQKEMQDTWKRNHEMNGDKKMSKSEVHDKKYVSHARQHANAYVESYDGPAGGYSGSERIAEAYQGSSQHDSRYSDLAPKNWDYPNGGPPRYAPPTAAPPLSTEYERPPPYYFPGPGVRD